MTWGSFALMNNSSPATLVLYCVDKFNWRFNMFVHCQVMEIHDLWLL